jgi:hypothetical protein
MILATERMQVWEADQSYERAASEKLLLKVVAKKAALV